MTEGTRLYINGTLKMVDETHVDHLLAFYLEIVTIMKEFIKKCVYNIIKKKRNTLF